MYKTFTCAYNEIYQGGDFKHRTDGHGVCCGFYVAHLEFAEHG